jgi:hypothetical protein
VLATVGIAFVFGHVLLVMTKTLYNQEHLCVPSLEALAIEAVQTVGVGIDSFYLYLLWTSSKQQDLH